MKSEEQRRVVEALILASPDPITLARLAQIVPHLKEGKAKDLINVILPKNLTCTCYQC